SAVGCGVTLAEKPYQMKPVEGKRQGKMANPPAILDPHSPELMLEEVGPDEAVLEQCGRYVLKFVDSKTRELLDFWIYNAFSDKTLEKLITHHSLLKKVKKIKRGHQFDYYSQGSMRCVGFRMAQGGRVADAYAMYEGMGASNAQSIHALLNHAEDDSILFLTAKAAHQGLCSQLKPEPLADNGFGITAATQYACDNYTSPLHSDKDAVHSLCAQYELKAEPKEYSFIFAEYRKYVVSRANSLWSFDGSQVHGTMLPSTQPLHSGNRISSGTHMTITRKNWAAAAKYEQVRHTNTLRGKYWEEMQ
ncbi:hypothetical protein BD779DRAFT_1443730, partial [Infundibulicybe gibba]